jgi:hypothetical protein
MAWTVAQVTSLFRDLTGRKSANQISDANILVEINHYFQYIFPGEAGIPEFKGWYTFNTVDGTGSQAIPDSVPEVHPPAYVDDDDATLWTDETRFYQEYPHDFTTKNKPSDILLLDRTLILRPIPDDAYEVRLRKKSSVPDALTSGDLDNSLWGPSIAYGTAIMFMSQKGEVDEAQVHAPVYKYHLDTIKNQIIRQQPLGRRPVGGRF